MLWSDGTQTLGLLCFTPAPTTILTLFSVTCVFDKWTVSPSCCVYRAEPSPALCSGPSEQRVTVKGGGGRGGVTKGGVNLASGFFGSIVVTSGVIILPFTLQR